jgi:DNA modification methylase
VHEVALNLLNPAEYNPRRITEQQLDALTRSMHEFGVVDPIIVNADGTVIGGHQRLKAAERLGLETVPVVYFDLSKPQEKALNLALNRISGEWDEDKLTALLAELADDIDLALTGFTDEELAAFLSGDTGTTGLTDPDDVPEPPEDPITKPGDLWLLGRHRVLCGDATVPTDLERLMGEERATVMFTDPPWNVAIGQDSNPRHRQRAGLRNDNLSEADFQDFLAGFIDAITPYITGDVYCVLGASEWPRLDASLRDRGYHWSATVIWVKDVFVLGRSKYHRRYEPIWYGWRADGKSSFCDARNLDDVWEIPRPRRSEDHPTTKPVELCARAIENSSKPGNLVVDPFLGSGSTLLAAHTLGRRCFGLELEPRYVDVIVRRWEAFTGERAVLDGDPRS